ncbi:MAG TPA: RpiB/LacA/LacB family sugar-phosphate isomerase [Tepidisphaeraceae bacterium]|jgi:ribose 5-phosphate isomerase RpiB|nr:RpiB/LacA/LacB family sugar-phosphate isomerase [Tepidisphaeraceae bacterium]
MIFSARQLEDLFKATGQIALPRAARLTPLAHDWLKSRKLVPAYTDLSAPATAASSLPLSPIPTLQSSYLYWCDGPCGIAKAALSAHRDVSLTPLQTPADPAKILTVAKELANALKSNSIAGGLVFVQSAATANLYLNRCPAIRAVLGTNLQTLDIALRQVAANVLVIETTAQSLQQLKNLVGRFVKAKRELSPETQRALQELSSCG